VWAVHLTQNALQTGQWTGQSSSRHNCCAAVQSSNQRFLGDVPRRWRDRSPLPRSVIFTTELAPHQPASVKRLGLEMFGTRAEPVRLEALLAEADGAKLGAVRGLELVVNVKHALAAAGCRARRP